VQALRKKKDSMKLSLPPKLVEKLVWVSVISLHEIFIPTSYVVEKLVWVSITSLYKIFTPSYALVVVVSEHFE
jgi:hypothetical protein